jgi:hypothetical protein
LSKAKVDALSAELTAKIKSQMDDWAQYAQQAYENG